RHTRFSRDWSSDVCSSDLGTGLFAITLLAGRWFSGTLSFAHSRLLFGRSAGALHRSLGAVGSLAPALFLGLLDSGLGVAVRQPATEHQAGSIGIRGKRLGDCGLDTASARQLAAPADLGAIQAVALKRAKTGRQGILV